MNTKYESLKPIKPNDSFISGTCFNKNGSVIAISQKFPKLKFLKKFDLYPRDLRKIDSSAIDIIPSILVKRNCMIINILYIKALITKNEVYVFDTNNSKFISKLGVLMYDLESKLGQQHANNNSQYYEHQALESILINITSTLETEFKLHYEFFQQLLIDLENQVNRDKLRDLLIKSKDLTLFFQKAILIRDVLDELLDNDEDMASMYLTNPIKGNQQIDDFDFADLEMLIETYYTQCDEYVQRSESLIKDIKSTEEIINIMLDANRNALMLLELKITIYTLGISVATLLPAFYGMNLKNFIEESNLGFGSVVILSILMGIQITRRNYKSLRATTKLTMMNNHTGKLSDKHAEFANDLTKRQFPDFQFKWREKFKFKFWDRLLNKTNNELVQLQKMKNKENREHIWKWLIAQNNKK